MKQDTATHKSFAHFRYIFVSKNRKTASFGIFLPDMSGYNINICKYYQWIHSLLVFWDIFRYIFDSYQLKKKKKSYLAFLLLTFEWILCCTFLINLSKYFSKTFCSAIVPPKITVLFSFQLSERTTDRSTKSPDLVEQKEILKQKAVAFVLQRDFVPSLQLIKNDFFSAVQ